MSDSSLIRVIKLPKSQGKTTKLIEQAYKESTFKEPSYVVVADLQAVFDTTQKIKQLGYDSRLIRVITWDNVRIKALGTNSKFFIDNYDMMVKNLVFHYLGSKIPTAVTLVSNQLIDVPDYSNLSGRQRTIIELLSGGGGFEIERLINVIFGFIHNQPNLFNSQKNQIRTLVSQLRKSGYLIVFYKKRFYLAEEHQVKRGTSPTHKLTFKEGFYGN